MKLLIVDDEKLTRSGLVSSIDGSLYGIDTILEASNGKEGLKIAKEQLPEIILTDMRMPQMTGVEMAERLRDILPDSAFIFMSGYSDREYLKAAIHLKAVSYVEKPLNMEEVTDAIRTAADQLITNGLVKSGKNAQSFENDSRLAKLLTQGGTFSLPEDITLPDSMRQENWFTSVILRFDKSVDITQTDLHFQALSSLSPLLSKHSLHEIHLMKENRCFCLFLYGPKQSKQELLKLSDKIREVFSRYEPFYLVLGDSFQGISHAFQSYSSAVILLQSAFFCPPGSVLSNTGETTVSPPMISDVSPDFYNALTAENKEECSRLLKELRGQFSPCCRLLPSLAKDIYYQFFRELLRAAKKARLSGLLERSGRSVWDMVENAESLDELHEELTSLTEEYFQNLSDAKSESGSGSSIVFEIREFIRQNYRNESLSIKSVSDHVKRSAPYVCTIFKAETGLTLNQYITEYRIDRAREMLTDPRYKIIDVAASVGYADVNYFGKIFKKIVGVSPSEYRSGK